MVTVVAPRTEKRSDAPKTFNVSAFETVAIRESDIKAEIAINFVIRSFSSLWSGIDGPSLNGSRLRKFD